MRRLALLVVSACSVGDPGGVPDGGGGRADAGASDAAPPGPDAAAPLGQPARYPSDRTLSPITAHVAAHLRAVAAISAAQRDDVFAKIGDSSTVSTHFMACFAGAGVDLAGRDELAATVEYFRNGDAGGDDPYRRTSLAATIGWSAISALAGDPSPIEQELAAVVPRFGLIMFGTNDVELGNIFRYGDNLLDIADLLLAGGIIPVYTAVMPRDDDPAADAWIPRYNAVARAVAQARQVPFIDLHRELLGLPGHGLAGDGVHLNVFSSGGSGRACDFTGAGLQFGNNVRNLVTLQTLDRLRRVVVEGEPAPDASAPVRRGAGTPADPFAIEALPFTDAADTRAATSDGLDVYDGCAAAQDESGPEYLYRLEVAAPLRVRAMVFDRGDVDIDVHLLRDSPEAAACVARNHQVLIADLEPGTWYFALDTFVSAGQELAGEYLFVVMPE